MNPAIEAPFEFILLPATLFLKLLLKLIKVQRSHSLNSKCKTSVTWVTMMISSTVVHHFLRISALHFNDKLWCNSQFLHTVLSPEE